METTDNLYQTAVHESGHFVAYLHFDEGELDFYCLSIVQIGNSKGRFGHDQDFEDLNFPAVATKVLIAGYASEFVLKDESNPEQYLNDRFAEDYSKDGSDAWRVTDVVHGYIRNEGRVEDFLIPYFNEAVEFLKSKWGVIEFVANTLIMKKEIEGEKLEELAAIVRDMLND